MACAHQVAVRSGLSITRMMLSFWGSSPYTPRTVCLHPDCGQNAQELELLVGKMATGDVAYLFGGSGCRSSLRKSSRCPALTQRVEVLEQGQNWSSSSSFFSACTDRGPRRSGTLLIWQVKGRRVR